MGQCWSFRGDDELDPDLEKWSKQKEKSFHIRQALRLYRASGCKYIGQNHDVVPEGLGVESSGEVVLSFDEWS